ncbi:MAG TPA: hypothetical protein VHB27_21830 [Rhodopila sp.]|uniref:hypothetical protein n=1 Tax=Rhodopila sp. TaxID=2480087 RepID=UPI002B78660F|nr:hypothetical protein [Rhodopila sp.]HVY17874.1 hypothetical protein [Rhodopila sp.]
MPDQQQSPEGGWDIERAQKHIDFASSVVTQAIKVAIALGGLLLVVYAAKERFFYDVSSLAAVGVLLIILVFFIGLIAVGLTYGMIATLWIGCLFVVGLNRVNWRGAHPKMRMISTFRQFPLWLASGVMFLLWCALIYVLASAGRYGLVYELGYFLLAGLMNTLFLGTEPVAPARDASRLVADVMAAAALTFALLFPFRAAPNNLLDQTMMLLGLRSTPGEPVSLTDKAHERVAAIAAAEGICFKATRIAPDIWLTRSLTLIWHGPGTMAIAALGEGTAQWMVIPLPSSDVDAYATSVRGSDGCATAATPSKVTQGTLGAP